MGEALFSDCMLENSSAHRFLADRSWADRSLADRSRRSWATLTSFAAQVVAIGLLLLLPLLRNVALPAARTVSTPVSLGRVRQPQSPVHSQRAGPAVPVTFLDPNRLLLPSHSPHIDRGNDEPGTPAPEGFVGDGIGLPGVANEGLPISILTGARPVMPAAPPKPAHMFRRSNMLEGSLIRRVQPTYPPLARSARVQGAVVLFATISAEGAIENLRVLSGHPLLVSAAIDAVKQWRYRPYILNGEPIEVETEITVNFVLGSQ